MPSAGALASDGLARRIAKLPGRFDNYKVSVEFSDAEELDALLD